MRRRPLVLLLACALLGQPACQAAELGWAEALERAGRVARQRPTPPAEYRERVHRQFGDALVADLDYQAAAENIAMDFHALGQRQKAGDGSLEAEIGVKAAEARYRASLERRFDAAKRQRLSREGLKALLDLESPPAELGALPPVVVPEDLPPAEALVDTLFSHNREWLEARSRPLPAAARRELRQSLVSRLLEARLDLDLILRGSRPRVAAEAAQAELQLERAREDLAQGRAADVGYALARTSDLRAAQVRVDVALAAAVLRLETLLGVRLAERPGG